jgi:hypothetical protein
MLTKMTKDFATCHWDELKKCGFKIIYLLSGSPPNIYLEYDGNKTSEIYNQQDDV